MANTKNILFILSGNISTTPRASKVAEFIQKNLRDKKIKPLSVEGIKEGHWVLLDYGHVIIHVFYDSVRNFYNLEGLWADARRIKTPAMIESEKLSAENGDDDDEE